MRVFTAEREEFCKEVEENVTLWQEKSALANDAMSQLQQKSTAEFQYIEAIPVFNEFYHFLEWLQTAIPLVQQQQQDNIPVLQERLATAQETHKNLDFLRQLFSCYNALTAYTYHDYNSGIMVEELIKSLTESIVENNLPQAQEVLALYEQEDFGVRQNGIVDQAQIEDKDFFSAQLLEISALCTSENWRAGLLTDKEKLLVYPNLTNVENDFLEISKAEMAAQEYIIRLQNELSRIYGQASVRMLLEGEERNSFQQLLAKLYHPHQTTTVAFTLLPAEDQNLITILFDDSNLSTSGAVTYSSLNPIMQYDVEAKKQAMEIRVKQAAGFVELANGIRENWQNIIDVSNLPSAFINQLTDPQFINSPEELAEARGAYAVLKRTVAPLINLNIQNIMGIINDPITAGQQVVEAVRAEYKKTPRSITP
ncbi:MAG: hypothetical protein ACOYK8_05680 [Alphaproteobacteria bacterium]